MAIIGSVGALGFDQELTKENLHPQFVAAIEMDEMGTEVQYFTSDPAINLPRGVLLSSERVDYLEDQVFLQAAPLANDYFGGTVSISDNGLVMTIGATAFDATTDYRVGEAWVYERASVNDIWSTPVSLVPSIPPVAADHYGISTHVSRDGSTIVVGAPGGGNAFVFRKSGGSWVPVLQVGATPSTRFGWQCALSENGDVVAIGAPFTTVSGVTNAGRVYVYRIGGAGYSYSDTVPTIDYRFGYNVALSPDGLTLFVGNHRIGANPIGWVRVFRINPTTISLTQTLTAPEGDSQSFFGANPSFSPLFFCGRSMKVSSNGNYLLVGDVNRYNPAKTVRVGGAFLFSRNDDGTYTYVTSFAPDSETEAVLLGYNLDISGDGSTIVLGAQSEDGVSSLGAPLIDLGVVYVFTRSATDGTYSKVAKVYPNGLYRHAYMYSGFSVWLDYAGRTLVTGATDYTGTAASQGAAFSYNIKPNYVFENTLISPSGFLQEINPEQGLSTIGSLSFGILDLDSVFTQYVRDKNNEGKGLRHKVFSLYAGFPGFTWEQFKLLGTQLIDRYSSGVVYKISGLDLQRALKERIFDLKFVNLTSTALIADTVLLTTNPVIMEPVEHGRSYGEAPAISTGTVSATNGSRDIVGTGTQWTTNRIKGARFSLDGAEYHVHKVRSNTNLQLETAFTGTTGAGKIYTAWPSLRYVKIEDEIINATGAIETKVTLSANNIGFTAGTNLIACTGTSLEQFPIGSKILISGASNPANNGTFTITDHLDASAPNYQLVTLQALATEAAGATVTIETPYQLYDCARGVLTSTAIEHTVNPAAATETKPKVNEYIYYEMPPVKLALALMTGYLYGQVGASIPYGHHLSIPNRFIDYTSFTTVLPDWWNPADDSGLSFRFTNLSREEGKRFIEQQILLPLNASLLVNPNGTLSIKRLVQVLYDHPASGTLNENNAIFSDEIEYGTDQVINWQILKWGFSDIRRDEALYEHELVDQTSIDAHGPGKDRVSSFKGLSGSQFTAPFIYGQFDTVRDRVANPPALITVKGLPATAIHKVGDILRVVNRQLRYPYAPSLYLDASMEVRSVEMDWQTLSPTYRLFGSTGKASLVSDLIARGGLSDTFYSTAVGLDPARRLRTALPSFVDGAGVVHISGNGTLTGHATDATDIASVYWDDAPVQIDFGVVITVTNNWQIRVKGAFTQLGKLDGKGLGSTTGWGVGESISQGAIRFGLGTVRRDQLCIAWSDALPVNSEGTISGYAGQSGRLNRGEISAMPFFSLKNKSTYIDGLPKKLSGATGHIGGSIFRTVGGYSDSRFAPVSGGGGGAGGLGGSGGIIISRGYFCGPSSQVDLSGTDGVSPSGEYDTNAIHPYLHFRFIRPSGSGGAPGGLLVLSDGQLQIVEGINTKLRCVEGITPVRGEPQVYSGLQNQDYFVSPFAWASASTVPNVGLDRAQSMLRIQRVPAP